MNSTRLLTIFSGITAVSIVALIAMFSINSYNSDRKSKSIAIFSTCLENRMGLYSSNSSLVLSVNKQAAEKMCYIFSEEYQRGKLSYEKALSILNDDDQYFRYISLFPEATELKTQIRKMFADHPSCMEDKNSCIFFLRL
jgi:hypothetical protein